MPFLSIKDKLLAGALGIGLVASLGYNIKQAFEKRDLSTQVATLDKQINDPVSGYVVKLGTCRANVSNLEGAIDRQNAASATAAARQQQALAEATAKVAEAQRRADRAENQARSILEYKPKGNTVCERMLDLDKRLLETVR